ncbi:MAG TPA: EAL domain-containing protein [Burkholderiaceae bacterium]|jgi:diguanylate cyclase (GGDEF)-like protein/PAS domain S-box-containing protein
MEKDKSGSKLAERTQAGLPLQSTDALFGELIENAFEIIIIINIDGIVCYANPSIRRVLGYSPAELIGMNLTQLIHADDVPRTAALIEQIKSGEPTDAAHPHLIEACFCHKGGSQTILESVFKALDTPTVKGIVINSRDITERKHEEILRNGTSHVLEMIATDASLQDVLIKLVKVIESHSDGILCAILLLNDGDIRMRLGAGPSIPLECVRAIEETTFPQSEPVSWIDIRQDVHWTDHLDHAAQYGLYAYCATPIFSSHGNVLGMFNMYFKQRRTPSEVEKSLALSATRLAAITIERHYANEKIGHMAYHDALTGLPNRILLKDRLNQAIIHAQRIKDGVAILFIDLDQFKLINDSLGHHVGDRLLQSVAQRLQCCMRKDDTLARFGGDEFVLVLMAPADGHSAGQVAEKIRDILQLPVLVDGHELHVGCSIGISLYPHDGSDSETLMRNADIAMYHAKERGRSNFQYFTPDLNVVAQYRHSIAHQLRQAIAKNEFTLDYQCQVDLNNGMIFGIEALIRWQQPERGLVAPLEFISIAEDTGLILPIGEWVLREGCTQLKRWLDDGNPNLSMSINLSVRQVLQPDIVCVIERILEETELPPSALNLEITENILMQPLQENMKTLKRLSNLGVKLSLDDFGTGYSSLSYLQRFSLNVLKIDQSFVRGIGNDENDMAIANAIIAMGNTMDLKVIAEGVETHEQATFLQQHGCHSAQGFYYSKPISAERVTELLRNQGV